jgi:hypothetical protein
MALTQVQGGMLAGSTNTTTTIQSNGTTAITIDSSQKVGIGIASPTAKLHVYGGSNNQFKVESSGAEANFTLAGTSYGQINNTTGDLYITADAASTNLIFRTASTERMRVNSSGNFMVGTNSAPNASTAIACFGGLYAFCLNSGVSNWYQGTNGNEFNVYSGDGVRRGYLTVAGTWTNTSDIAYKKDIVDIKYGLQDALNLRPVSYLTKDYEIPQIGFIAQEMEQVIPEVVSGKEGEKGISYGSLVALCIKAIQDLNAKVDAQAAEIAALKGA